MNFILAFILTIIFYAIIVFGGVEVLTSMAGINVASIVLTMIYYAIVVNIGLGVFNLIPIPPLDGSKIFLRLLPWKAQRWINENILYIQLIFMFLFVFNIFTYITAPVIEIVLTGIEFIVSKIFLPFI